MRINNPVTLNEYQIDSETTLQSATDPQGNIFYANAAFVNASGYHYQDLVNQPHNIVRHPDMPPAAFADMWHTLHAGHSWSALVKNRRNNGDFYWVRANATPICHNGRTTGYLSVRIAPTREEVKRAAALYSEINSGKAKRRRLALYRGLLVRTGILSPLSIMQKMPLRWRLRIALLVAAALPSVGAGGLALGPVALGAVTLGGLALTAYWLHRQVEKPIVTILAQAQRLSSCQVGEYVHFNRVDEIGYLLRSVNQMGLNLRSLTDDVSGQINDINNASGEIAVGNRQLKVRTEQAGDNLQQIICATEELAASVGNSAASVNETRALAAMSESAAEEGRERMTEVISTMGAISDSSRRIVDIISVIEGIAFQTNILALNAAVEAARAGDQGRGFAVVAGEVRQLAQRSSTAAREIKDLIETSVERIQDGSKLVQNAGAAMDSIVSQAGQVTGLIGEISISSQEQTKALTLIGQSIGQLDHTTQQNAAMVERYAQSAEDLSHSTVRLAAAVNVYRPHRELAAALPVTRRLS
ncbi:methyl-accepting chemotaxis protein [Acerihabitans arboris]|uniref:PAS domain-containing protein n=1 Tax=Acerihabitans arboris TaxID=2691583 RepID=A0A845SGJ5_9GAMM|nr:PAS domain-containing methyl-accepting chemotaxis protein [Acerihabitans arboris]NDL61751.1 PAS domain-containing protein [Acerihabitans arboris]